MPIIPDIINFLLFSSFITFFRKLYNAININTKIIVFPSKRNFFHINTINIRANITDNILFLYFFSCSSLSCFLPFLVLYILFLQFCLELYLASFLFLEFSHLLDMVLLMLVKIPELKDCSNSMVVHL